MNDIEYLTAVIHHLHGVKAKHVESVLIKEEFRGETVWEGLVEVFDLEGHPDAPRVCAWAYKPHDQRYAGRYVTVLHIPPVVSPLLAVRAAIRQEYRNRADKN